MARQPEEDDPHRQFVLDKIEKLRPGLLDLTRRNPLINCNLSNRSAPYVRVIDELPDVLLNVLKQRNSMTMTPLPPLEWDPFDESTAEFRDALEKLKWCITEYHEELDALEEDDEQGRYRVERETEDRLRDLFGDGSTETPAGSDEGRLGDRNGGETGQALTELKKAGTTYLEKTEALGEDNAARRAIAERELKDWLRKLLGMKPREVPPSPNLQQHARNNLIDPSYELPLPSDEHEDGRHTDDLIQTLLLPSGLEAVMNKIRSRSNSWEQETGVNVLHVGFGLLEWQLPGSGDINTSPIVMLPASLERKRSPSGPTFLITGTGEAEVNPALMVALQEAGVDLPEMSMPSVEDYLQQVVDCRPNFHWRVRRQVVVGVFPSADLATYRDLDTSGGDLIINESVRDLLAGRSAEGEISPFATDYDVDDPSIEKKVPFCILDADSSQFSALADIADGKHLAIEGPPGTGKSQTIVNAIANAMIQGRKVLFVAQKQAALNVVFERLKERGLGEFVLPLMPGAGARGQTLESIRERVDMKRVKSPGDLDDKIRRRRELRGEISRYLEIMHQDFGERGLTVHQILGSSVAWDHALNGLPEDFQNPTIEGLTSLSAADITERQRMIREYANAHRDTYANAGTVWSGVQAGEIDHRSAATMTQTAAAVADQAEELAVAVDEASALGVQTGLSDTELVAAADHLEKIGALVEVVDLDLVEELGRTDTQSGFRRFIDGCIRLREQQLDLAEKVEGPFDGHCADVLKEMAISAETLELSSIDEAEVERRRSRIVGPIDKDKDAVQQFRVFLSHMPVLEEIPLGSLSSAAALVSSVGAAVLGLRNEANTVEGAASSLRAVVDQGQALRVREQQLGQYFRLDRLPVEFELRQAASTLRNSGSTAFLSAGYRAARRLYRSLAHDGKASPQVAADRLDELRRWRKDMDDFQTSGTARRMFGDQFRGIQTDFESFAELARLFETMDELLVGVAVRPLREFLRTAPVGDLMDLPGAEASRPEMTCENLAADLLVREKLDADFRAGAAVIEQHRDRVRSPGFADPRRLRDWATIAADCNRRQRELNSETAMTALIGGSIEPVLEKGKAFDNEFSIVTLARRSNTSFEAVIELARTGQLSTASRACLAVVDRRAEVRKDLARLCDDGGLPGHHFGTLKDPAELAENLRRAANDNDGLLAHADLAGRRQEIERLGLAWTIDSYRQYSGDDELQGLQGAVAAIHWRGLALLVQKEFSQQLSGFRGHKLDDLRARFARLDREIIRLSALRLRSQIASEARPPGGNGTGKTSTFTELSLINHNLNLKKPRVTARVLTSRAGRALRELMPCWMMSPQAVSQYLPRNAEEFDLCIIDEASQMRPEHAVGALLRSKQAVVVGDVNQMPPTSFFRRMVADGGDDDDGLATVQESILELANQTFLPKRILRWHYRSQHPDLIQFSNMHMYRGAMTIFPNALNDPALGVRIKRVDGVYAGSRNPIEADAIVEAALEHFRADPDRSLGIVTMNLTQAELIEERLEQEISRDPVARAFVDKREGSLEGLFVKNLENVQGDERDVIFIGTLYGPGTPGGAPAQRFGPVTGVAGQRRLNVLFSRARQRVVTFTSLDADQISATAQSNPGSFMLKSWLTFCHTGQIHGGHETDLPPDSEFEVHVADQIRSMGCEPVPQVGVHGYFIDIGVRHPAWPHGFLLGVECDGAAYHSSRSARDRDRLREEVLNSLGWRLHRIWSTDWFRNPRGEADKLRDVIERTLQERNEQTRVWKAAPRGANEDRETPPANTETEEVTAEISPETGAEEDLGPEVSELFSDPGGDANKLFDVDEGPGSAVSQDELEKLDNDSPGQQTVRTVQVGDMVRARYLDHDQATLLVTISSDTHDPSNGVIGHGTPLGEALLDSEEGEEVELLVGHRLRRAIVENFQTAQ